jgi:hypothetical protein
VEVRPADEQPDGLPDQTRALSPTDRGDGGRFAPGNALARVGGRARAGKARLAVKLGKLPVGYQREAVAFRRAQCSALASMAGGVCGAAPSSMVASASLQLAWSRYFSDQAAETGDPGLVMTASRLADASRQNLLAAWELATREAAARPRTAMDPMARIRAQLGAKQ